VEIENMMNLKRIHVATVADHYEKHLARYYSWMFGDFHNTIEANRQFFVVHKLIPESPKLAIDLGAGCGFQSIPLAQMGFSVLAIDLRQELLDELRGHIGQLSITVLSKKT